MSKEFEVKLFQRLDMILEELRTKPKKKKSEKSKTVSEMYIVLYKRYKEMFNAPLSKDGKTFGIIRRLLASYSTEQIDHLFQVYLQIDDPFFRKRKYDLVAFEQGLQKVIVAASTGHDDDNQLSKARLEHERDKHESFLE